MTNDISLIIQGPFNTVFLEKYDEYLKLFDQIVISTYTNDIPKIEKYRKLFDNHKTKLVLNSLEVPKPYSDQYRAWYQAMTTLAGLNSTTTAFAAKTRCDEYYSNVNLLIDKIKKEQDKIHCINLYFRKDSELKWHMSDHLFGGKRNTLTSAMKLVIDWSKNLEELIQIHRSLNYPESKFGAAITQEMKIIYGIFSGIDPSNSKQDMIRYFEILPIKYLEPFHFTNTTEPLVHHTSYEAAISKKVGPGMTNWMFDTVEEYMRD